MTCKQVRQLLAAYRRDDCSPAEHAELQAHLLECAECRMLDAEFRRVGESIQSLPQLAPPPDFFARVMAAVQAEETKAPAKVEEKKPETVVVPGLTNVLHYPRLRRAVAERKVRLAPMRSTRSPAATFALRYGAAMAATFLIFGIGLSVALFQLLGNTPPPGPSGSGPVVCINAPCYPLHASVLAADSVYSIVGDATASPDGQYVVYAAHTPQGSWMLEELNRQTGKSVALLPAAVGGPLTIEGWARSWVLWAQGDPKSSDHWQLSATELAPALPGAAETLQLLRGGLSGQDGAVLALRGVHTFGSTVLLAEQRSDERGRLVQLDLTNQGASSRSVLATSQPKHWIADPTTDGQAYYWADEWLDPDGTPHGDIMRLIPTSTPTSEPVAITFNGVSFAPMIVAQKLVWLEELLPQSAQSAAAKQDTPTATATPPATATLTPGGGSASNSPVAGTLWSTPLDDQLLDLDSAPRQQVDADASMPQAGATFVVVQESNGDFTLYDLANDGKKQALGAISNALVVSVSPTAVLWVTADTSSNSQFSNKTNMNLLDWPQR